MKKKLHPNLFTNNSGVGLVAVVIAVAFLMVIGSVILFISYNSVEKSVASQAGNEIFYDAESALDQIQAGLQSALSKSFKTAYDSVLANYSKESADAFFDTFKSELQKNNSEVLDFTANTYSFESLKSFLTESYQAVTAVGTSDPNATEGIIVIDETSTPKTATLKDVHVTVSKDGRTSSVTADLVMTIPSIEYVDTGYSLTGLNSFCMIAQKGLNVFSATYSPKISGDAFAGSISVTGNTLTSTNGMLVCADKLSVDTAGHYVLSDNGSLWTKDIEVGVNSDLKLNGETYVANDLNLAGNGSKAILGGRYIGYGNSAEKSSESSAIYANGKNTKLILSDSLNYFMLAGYSFIDLADNNPMQTNPNSNLRMAESISARSNQQLYLIPADSIRYEDEDTLASVPSNPVVTSEAEARKMLYSTIRTTDPLLTGADVEVSAYRVGDQWIVYFFMQFKDAEEANDYFINYFSDENNEANAEKMNTYLDSYISVAKDAKSILTAGTAFRNATTLSGGEETEKSELELFNMSTVYANSEWLTTFNNLSSTLTSYSASDDENMTPYDYYVRSDAELWNLIPDGGLYFYDKNNKAVAVVVNGDYTFKSSSSATSTRPATSDIRLIIANGDVTMNSSFTGSIMSNGSVTLTSSCKTITANPLKVSRASTATAKDVKYNGEALTAGAFLYESLAVEQNTGVSTQNYDVVVTKENWRNA